jgi:signal transduction histidine kinase
MSLSNVTFIRTTALLLLVGLATLIGIVGVTFWLSVRTSEISTELTGIRQLRAQVVELRNLLQDAETGQRGFLLTSDPNYLAPYDAARTKITDTLARLDQVIPEGEKPALERLRTIATSKMNELAKTIAEAKAGRLDNALAIVRSDEGKVYMDEARAELGGLITRGDDRIVSAMSRQSNSILRLQQAVVLGALMIVLVGGSAVFMALRYTRELISARTELGTLNTGLEQRVAERTAELGRANTELQRFAYIVGHDLRSPLVNVMGFTSELTEFRKEIFANMAELREKTGVVASPVDEQLQRDFDEAVGFIRTSTTKMDGLINAILKLSREGKRPLTPEPIDMGKLIGDAAVNVLHRVQERDGNVDVKGNFPTITSDRFSLEQVFGNLLDNAVKYSSPDRPPQITISASQKGANVMFDVADNGRGIAENEYERVFELFRRAGRQDQPGEGIGLAYVRAHVRRLGGDITVTSKLGEGSTFHVRLPRTLSRSAIADV